MLLVVFQVSHQKQERFAEFISFLDVILVKIQTRFCLWLFFPFPKAGHRQDVRSLESWKKLVDSQSVWLSTVPSILILKH